MTLQQWLLLIMPNLAFAAVLTLIVLGYRQEIRDRRQKKDHPKDHPSRDE